MVVVPLELAPPVATVAAAAAGTSPLAPSLTVVTPPLALPSASAFPVVAAAVTSLMATVDGGVTVSPRLQMQFITVKDSTASLRC